MWSGRYRSMRFLIEFNSNLVFPGDLHRYIFPHIAGEYINRPNQKKDELMEFVTDGSLIEMAEENESECNSRDIIKTVNSIYHELIHYIQEFSLGSEILRDMLSDQIGGCVLQVLKECSQEKTRLHAPARENLQKHHAVGWAFQELEDRYQGIYRNSITIDMGDGEKTNISVEDLLEGYASVKSYYFMLMTEAEESRDKYSEINKDYFVEKLNDTYHKAWKLYKKFLRFNRDDNDGEGKITESLTLDVRNFLMICDISLHIPPFLRDEYERTADGEMPECCLPHLRFIKILITLTKNKGFPDAVEGTDFYIILYDFVALDNGWPTFLEVNRKWMHQLKTYLMPGFMDTDLYRWVALSYKGQYPTGIALEEWPIRFFDRTGIPILVKYVSEDNDFSGEKYFFEYMYLWYGTIFPVMDDLFFSPMKDPYNIMAHAWYRNHWNYSDVWRVIGGEDYKHILKLAPTFLREIYCRIIFKAFFDAVIRKTEFCCPVIELNCKVKKDECMCLKKLTDLPEHCCLKIWLDDMKINPETVTWE